MSFDEILMFDLTQLWSIFLFYLCVLFARKEVGGGGAASQLVASSACIVRIVRLLFEIRVFHPFIELQSTAHLQRGCG